MMLTAYAEPQRKIVTEQFYAAIRTKYKSLREVKKHGVRLYSDEYIFAELGRLFYRSPRTIENILFNRV